MDLCKAKLQPGYLILEVANTPLFHWDSVGIEVLSMSEDKNGNIKVTVPVQLVCMFAVVDVWIQL